MIRIFKLVLLLVVSQVAFGQAPSNYININGRYRWIAGMFDSTFHIPKGTAASLRTGGSTNAGALFYNTTDSSVYTYTGTQWIKLRGTIIDTTSLSNRINLKLNISDTASMLSPYLRKVDTASLSNRINLKLNISDTASMLSPYLRKVDTTNKFVTQVYKKNGSDSVFYVRGGNHLWAFNDSTGNPGGGGGGKIYYFNGGVSMGTFGGFTMYELGDTANTGAAANFTRATTGNIANFITDPGKPGLLQIPAGVWTIDAYLSETGGGSNNAEIYVQVEKWDGSTITTIATSPIEQITNGSVIDLYTWAVSIPTTSLAVTDRIIIQFYIQNTNGKTVTLYTQNGYVGEVHTTFTTGIGAINGLTAPAQYLVTGTSGTDFNISSVTATHTFNLPTASATNRGALSSADWTAFNNKGSVSSVATNNATGITGGTITTTGTLAIDTTVISTRLWRQKGIDSVQSNLTAGLALKVNISDTSSMLLPYLRKIDTASLSNRINLKVNISDTASMLSPYLRAIDTASLSNRINLKVNISDTSSMLNPYLRKADTTSMLANYVNAAGYGLSKAGQVLSADSATLSNYYLRRKDSLTATNLLGYVTRKILADTAAAIRSADAGGTVTSVATNNGTGITGGTITTSGTLAIDTLLIATRAWRQKGIDSVEANLTSGLATKLNISDTSSMLTPYLRKVDTASLSNRINLKVNISDTSTMLGNYVNSAGYGITKAGQVVSADSATLSAYYLRRKDSLTSTNLLGYVTRTVLADSAAAIRAAAGAGTVTGSGTATRVAFWNGTSSLSSNADLYWDNTNSRLGIGTSSPVEKLDVRGKGYFNNGGELYLDANATNTVLASTGARTLLFEVNSANRMAITSTGTVGIGTTTIGSTLQVNGNAAIGYSTSTAAPTNGLLVAGDINISATGSSTTTPRIIGVTGITAGTAARFQFGDENNAIQNSHGGLMQMLSFHGMQIYGARNGTAVSFATAQSTDPSLNVISSSTTRSTLVVTAAASQTGNLQQWRNSSNTALSVVTSDGSLGLKTTTVGSTLQVNGNAAIGYSASTAAPTNGLAVSGNVLINAASSDAKLIVDNDASNYAAYIRANTLYSSSYRIMRWYANTNVVMDILSNGTDLEMYNNRAGYVLLGTNGTERFRINSTGSVFIGNGETAASPSTGIISGTGGSGTNIAGAEFRIRGGASTGNAAGGPITFYTSAAGSSGSGVNAATERMRINNAGNVGIGVTDPDIFARGDARMVGIGASGASDNLALALNAGGTGGRGAQIYMGQGGTRHFTISSNVTETTLGTSSSTPLKFTTNDIERMRITSGGNVGIGTTNPGYQFQVNGSDASVALRSSDGTSEMRINAQSGIAILETITNTDLRIRTNSTEKMRITSGGNLLVGTTTDNGAMLQVAGSGTFSGGVTTDATLRIRRTSDINQYIDIYSSGGEGFFDAINSNNSTRQAIIFRQGNNVNTLESMRITSGGNVGIGTTTIGSTLQVNGNAAIGYSASTAAPSNGLSISGNTTIGTSTAAGKFTIDPDDNQVGLAITGTSLTSANAQSLIDLAQTWNTSGNPTAIKLNITNTASGATTNLMDLQVGGTSQYKIDKAGNSVQTGTIKTTAGNAWNLKQGGVAVGGADGLSVLVDIDGTQYYLLTGYPPEPEPEATSGPSIGYKAKFEQPTIKIKSDNQKIKDLENEIAQLKELIKSKIK
jgi:hypothetical protein